MPAIAKEINLLPRDKLSSGLWSKVISWALTIGRYIVITTELVVVLAFLFRFRYDMQLAETREEIKENQQVIRSYQDLEKQFRHLQARTTAIKEVEAKGITPSNIYAQIGQMVPRDVYFDSLDINKKAINISGVSLSDAGLITFLHNIQISDSFTKLSLDSLSSGDERDPQLKFSLSLETR